MSLTTTRRLLIHGILQSSSEMFQGTVSALGGMNKEMSTIIRNPRIEEESKTVNKRREVET